ncbi:MAG: hypothetical protein UX24_C0007G0012 [Candidatus Giovannonibacteria bacterium GW2011_GWB1_45_9b]|uniref:Uncharacterized protein n=3 Tax=Candidatus Giovannoniibacteriota TaxID=1752738 RepID=A0A1F5WDT3_9BACT|nr:MAG: hypothetical protein UX06_C0018G0006 [Candidatus Giovannonibacteria bacterium GW2011_GWA2_45_21]KKU16571.1 MAG: hypothetical protein UX24_C0007G0012 [Candidatus Giovannonibacteria bacterium GW2011_GWB1_45_9b]OGF73421.1 MAG: hypothetical protein A2W57_00105 [Candidatus Giovannonibacteria bacterium RIFCSPHIGHO2_02_43_16]
MPWEGCYIVKGSFNVVPVDDDLLVGKTAIVSLQVMRWPSFGRGKGNVFKGCPIRIRVNTIDAGVFLTDDQGMLGEDNQGKGAIVPVSPGKNWVEAWIEDTSERASRIIDVEGPRTPAEKAIADRIAGYKSEVREIKAKKELDQEKRKASPIQRKIEALKKRGEFLEEEKKIREASKKPKLGEPTISFPGTQGRYRLNVFVLNEDEQPMAGVPVNVTVSVPGEHEYPLEFLTDAFGRVDEYIPIAIEHTVVNVRVQGNEKKFDYLETLPPPLMTIDQQWGLGIGLGLIGAVILVGFWLSTMAP